MTLLRRVTIVGVGIVLMAVPGVSGALTLLDTVLARLRQEHEDANKLALFEALKPALTGQEQPAGYSEIASRLHMSEGAVKVAAHRLRVRYAELLRTEIAQTVSEPQEIDDEIRQLFSALGSR